MRLVSDSVDGDRIRLGIWFGRLARRLTHCHATQFCVCEPTQVLMAMSWLVWRYIAHAEPVRAPIANGRVMGYTITWCTYNILLLYGILLLLSPNSPNPVPVMLAGIGFSDSKLILYKHRMSFGGGKTPITSLVTWVLLGMCTPVLVPMGKATYARANCIFILCLLHWKGYAFVEE